MAKITFSHLAIENFGPFKARQVIDLTVKDDRPVVLIKALNGSGKTTLLTALQVSLYGANALSSGRRSDYESLIKDSFRMDAISPASMQLQLVVEQGHTLNQVCLIRSWSREKKFTETLKVLVNGEEDVEWTQNWDEYINGILPAELIQLFLFDGEKIEALANPEQLPELLRQASEVFLGLGGIDALNADLKALERRLLLSRKDGTGQLKDQNRKQLEQLLKVSAEQNDKVALLLQKKADARNELDNAEKALNKYALAANRSGAETYKKAAELQSNLEVAVQQHKSANAALVDLMEHPLVPLLWLDEAWSTFKNNWQQDRQGRHIQLLSSEFAKRDEKLLKLLRLSQPDAYALMSKLMAADLEEFTADKLEMPVLSQNTNPNEIEAQLQRLVSELRRHYGSLMEKMLIQEQAQRAIAQIPAEEQLTDILQTLQQKTTIVALTSSMLQVAQSELEKAQDSYFLTEAKIETLRQKMGSTFADVTLELKSLNASSRAREVLNVFKEKLLFAKATWLSKSITSEFKKLIRKQNLISEVLVDPVSYKVSIKDGGGYILPMERLSAGERQLLAIAVLSALIGEHTSWFPVVVDTPLARLDRSHRNLLIENFFTKISHQVVVLSTDEEVDGLSYTSLAPYLSRELALEYDDQESQTNVCGPVAANLQMAYL